MRCTNATFGRRQVKPILAALVIVVSAILGGCGTTGPTSATTPSADGSFPAPIEMSRAQEFHTVEDLIAASELVVVGRMDSLDLTPDTAYGDKIGPRGIATINLLEVLVGTHDAAVPVRVSLEAGIDPVSKKLYTSRLQADQEYLLFLTPIGDKLPGIYATTGYVAGVYVKDAGSGLFHKTDDESVALPERIAASDLQAAAARMR